MTQLITEYDLQCDHRFISLYIYAYVNTCIVSNTEAEGATNDDQFHCIRLISKKSMHLYNIYQRATSILCSMPYAYKNKYMYVYIKYHLHFTTPFYFRCIIELTELMRSGSA